MRITLNTVSKCRLLRIMLQRGVENPTHMINVLLDEAAIEQPIPITEDAHGNSNTEQVSST
jgi:hypothetical protein